MWCAEGLRSVKLPDVQQLKFANPVIESEFRRALGRAGAVATTARRRR